MIFWTLVPLGRVTDENDREQFYKAGEKLRDLLAPFIGETNRLDGWRPSTVWVKGMPTEREMRLRWDEEARADYRNYVERNGGLAAALIGLGADDEQLREAFDVRQGESENEYVARKQVIPFAFLDHGEWCEQAVGEDSDEWRARFAAAYAQIPDGTACVWVRCHR